MPSIADETSPVAVGIKNGEKLFVAVWRLKGDQTVTLPNMGAKSMKIVYPDDLGIKLVENSNDLIISFPEEFMGVIVELD